MPFLQVIIGGPTLQQRKAILTVLCARMPVCPSVDMAELAQRTTGYVGADLSALCREAAMNAIRENSKVNTAIKEHVTKQNSNIFLLLRKLFLAPAKFTCIILSQDMCRLDFSSVSNVSEKNLKI